ncbi:MAG: GNAT family N-acetyltransferase [Pyrinomonadaceae bacterium]
MNFDIRKAVPTDIPGVIVLLHEFAKFENLTEYLEITEENLADVLFGSDAFVECLVAFEGNEMAGYAILYPNFATFRGQKGMYLEDLYIRDKCRGKGLGDMLLKEIARLARALGANRLDFVVLDWNAPAIKFYNKHGAAREDEERRFKFVDEAFETLAS